MFLPTGFDTTILHAVQSALTTWQITLAKILHVAGAPELWVIIGLGLTWWLYQKKKTSKALVLLWLTAGNILTPILKAVFHSPRPTADQARLFITERDYGFPSGHAIGAALLVAAVWWWTSRMKRGWRRVAVRWAAVIFAILVGWSRVALGVHWPIDVLAGYLVGAVWGIAVVRLARTGRK